MGRPQMVGRIGGGRRDSSCDWSGFLAPPPFPPRLRFPAGSVVLSACPTGRRRRPSAGPVSAPTPAAHLSRPLSPPPPASPAATRRRPPPSRPSPPAVCASRAASGGGGGGGRGTAPAAAAAADPARHDLPATADATNDHIPADANVEDVRARGLDNFRGGCVERR
ncbi:hypothetical protein I4F81_011220 [Pyropia yezoensis]|uniref:Uncharacterized protein n=1 Tax=Pyropia yezoensis TaxID=2788 RepID=A0ACC3CG32_PYRYE|nr:hypothetical protein I4F81_011220 [Neopyropia yezoensis]